MPPTISICIPCYQSERYIRTTIESVLAQTVLPDELLISDDNSTDRSFEIVSEYQGVPPVKIIRPEHRLTLGAHYRFLLERATGDYVTFLSSDDALMPNYVETMHAQLVGESDVTMIASACLECDSNLRPTRLRGGGLPDRAFSPPEGFRFFTRGNQYTISVALLSRSILLSTPPIPAEANLTTDWGWALLLGARGKVKFIRTPLGYYRFHGSNASRDKNDEWQRAGVALMVFLSDYLGTEFGRELAPEIEALRGQIASRQEGRSEAEPGLPLSEKGKNLVKGLLALRYRALPFAIAQAEKGFGVALERSKSVHA